MQANMKFMQENHPQGRQPLEAKQTAPHQSNRKPFMTTQYAYSIKTSRVKEPDFPYGEIDFGCTSDVIAFANSLQDADIEKMLILYLNAQNKLICIQTMNGTVNQCCIYPREIFRHAIISGACAVILLHNHPSGCIKPSDADIRLTNQVRDLIVGENEKHFSFREEGLLS